MNFFESLPWKNKLIYHKKQKIINNVEIKCKDSSYDAFMIANYFVILKA